MDINISVILFISSIGRGWGICSVSFRYPFHATIIINHITAPSKIWFDLEKFCCTSRVGDHRLRYILMFDADMLVNNALEVLINLNLQGKTIGVTRDIRGGKWGETVVSISENWSGDFKFELYIWNKLVGVWMLGYVIRHDILNVYLRWWRYCMILRVESGIRGLILWQRRTVVGIWRFWLSNRCCGTPIFRVWIDWFLQSAEFVLIIKDIMHAWLGIAWR